jgi:hypothetical protein
MQVATTSPERAKALYDLISAEARESELAGRLTDRAAQALLDANLFSMLIARSNVRGRPGRVFRNRGNGRQSRWLSGLVSFRLRDHGFLRFEGRSRRGEAGSVRRLPGRSLDVPSARAQAVAVEAGYRVSGRFG